MLLMEKKFSVIIALFIGRLAPCKKKKSETGKKTLFLAHFCTVVVFQ